MFSVVCLLLAGFAVGTLPISNFKDYFCHGDLIPFYFLFSRLNQSVAVYVFLFFMNQQERDRADELDRDLKAIKLQLLDTEEENKHLESETSQVGGLLQKLGISYLFIYFFLFNQGSSISCQ